jgi:DNA-binding NtrC family response regulator
MNTYRILLLDDDDFILGALRRELLSEPFIGHKELEIEAFNSPLAALVRAGEPDGYFDLVIADNRMSGMSGIDFLKAFGEIQPEAVRVILSGYPDMHELVRAINEAHIDAFITKPWQAYDLKSALWQVLKQYDLRSENRKLAKQYLERFGLHHQLNRKVNYRLMIVDDDLLMLQALQRELNESYIHGAFGMYQLEVQCFEHVDAALEEAHEQQYDVVICDYAMPVLDGIEFLRMFREVQPDAVRILISGVADMEVLVAAVNTANVSYFVGKPWRDYELRIAIDRALAHREFELDNRFLADLLRLKSRHS